MKICFRAGDAVPAVRSAWDLRLVRLNASILSKAHTHAHTHIYTPSAERWPFGACSMVSIAVPTTIPFPPIHQPSYLKSSCGRKGSALLRLREEGGAARLDSLDLRQGQLRSPEAGGQLVAVEEDALGGLDRPQLGAGGAADAGLAGALDGLPQGPELLGVVPVGAESGVRVARGKNARR